MRVADCRHLLGTWGLAGWLGRCGLEIGKLCYHQVAGIVQLRRLETSRIFQAGVSMFQM